MQYIIVKKKKSYFIYDLLKNDVEEPNTRIRKYKDNKVYKHIIYDEIDDLEEIAREFCHLESYGCLSYESNV